MSLLLNDSAASFGRGAEAPRHIFCRNKEKRLSIKEGSQVEYRHQGQAYVGKVEAVLWIGGLKARIIPQKKGHPTTHPVKELKLVKETA